MDLYIIDHHEVDVYRDLLSQLINSKTLDKDIYRDEAERDQRCGMPLESRPLVHGILRIPMRSLGWGFANKRQEQIEVQTRRGQPTFQTSPFLWCHCHHWLKYHLQAVCTFKLAKTAWSQICCFPWSETKKTWMLDLLSAQDQLLIVSLYFSSWDSTSSPAWHCHFLVCLWCAGRKALGGNKIRRAKEMWLRLESVGLRLDHDFPLSSKSPPHTPASSLLSTCLSISNSNSQWEAYVLKMCNTLQCEVQGLVDTSSALTNQTT